MYNSVSKRLVRTTNGFSAHSRPRAATLFHTTLHSSSLRAMAVASFVTAAMLTVPALAQDTRGGGGGASSPGPGGLSSLTGAGEVGYSGSGYSGAAGGGAGTTGGNGGSGSSGSLGGAGGATAGASGGNGADETFVIGGGGGGGGGAHGAVFVVPTILGTGITGGHGGAGGNASPGDGGGGGAGGHGVVVDTGGSFSFNATITGGSGGRGGDGLIYAGSGGDGGHGLVFAQGATAAISGTVTGGNGGATGNAPILAANGNGGFGIVGSNVDLTLNALVSGGLSGNGTTRAASLRLGGSNRLTLQAGAGFVGDIVTEGGGNIEFAQPSSATLDTAITGAGSISISGLGMLTLTAANTYSGGTTISGGALQIGNGGTTGTLGTGAVTNNGYLSFNRSDTLTVGNAISGSGTLYQVGSGTTILTSNNSYTGITSINNGALQIGNGGTTGSLGTGSVTNNGTLIFNRSDSHSFGGSISGAGDIAVTGGGTLTLTGASTHTGTLTVESGILNVQHSLALGVREYKTVVEDGAALEIQGNISLPEETIINGSGIANGGAIRHRSGASSLGGAISLASDARINSDGGIFDLTLIFGNGNALTMGGAGFTRVNSSITGISDFIKDGSGTVLLTSGSNNFTGSTQINSGNLLVRGGNAISDTSAVTVTAGLFGIQASETIASLAGAGGEVRIYDNVTLTTGDNNNTLFAGVITEDAIGTGRLVKNGHGVFTLTGNNSYSGGTSINAGVVQLGYGGTTGSITGPVSVASGAALNFNRSDRYTFDGRITGAGSIHMFNIATVVLTGNNTAGQDFTGEILTLAGRLDINGDIGDLTGNNAQIELGTWGTLGGSGTFFGDVDAQSGTIAPGNSPGTLTIAGDLTLGTGTILNFELGEAGAVGGANNDLVVVGGDLTLDGTLNTIAWGPGYGPGYYRLFNYGGTLTDNGLSIGSIAGGYTPTILTNISGQINLLLGDASGQVVQYWDGVDTSGATAGSGGSGIWGAGGTNWTGPTGYAVNDTWQSGLGVFGGTAGGTVTVEGVHSFQELRFDTAGYTLEAGTGGELATTGGFSVIDVDAAAATINVGISGSGGLTKTGTGTLVLGAANGYSGGTVISEGTLQIGNGGTSGAITGPIENYGTLSINRSDDIVFSQILTGTGSFVQAGTGTTTLAGSNGLSGGFVASGGRLRGDTATFGTNTIRADATVEFAQTVDGTFGAVISGIGILEKTGAGRLILTGNSDFSGATRLLGGGLTVNGTLAQSAFTVASGTRLSGSGTVGNLTVESGGIVAPGNSIGTLTVNGDISFDVGSIYEVEVDPAGTAADLIAASGIATLNGGSVVHIGLDDHYRPEATYTILTAAGGVQGEFSEVTSSFAFLNPTLGYTANAVTLTLTRNDVDFDDVAVTPNQVGVADGIEGLGFGNTLFDAVLLLDEEGARGAFDQLSGEIYPSLLSGFFQDSRFVRDAALDRMRVAGTAAGAEPGVRFWVQGLGTRGHLDGDGNARRLKQDSAGFLIGVDAIAHGTVQLGAFGGYQKGDASVRAATSEADISQYHAGIYAGADLGAWGLRTGYAFSWHKADVTRRIAFADFSDTTNGTFDALTAQFYAEAGYRFDFGATKVEPFAQIAQVWIDSKRMQETGGAGALQVARSEISTRVSTVGARLDQSVSLGSLAANFKLSAGWRHAFGDHVPETASNFGGSSSFRIAGAPIARNAFAGDIGFSLALSDRARFDVTYSGDVASKAESHSGRATLSWAF